MLPFTERILLDPTFFPRLSHAVGEKMLGSNVPYRLLDGKMRDARLTVSLYCTALNDHIFYTVHAVS